MRPSVDWKPPMPARSVALDLRSESLYGRLAAHFTVHMSSLAETRLPQYVLNQPIFGPPWQPEHVAALASFLRSDPDGVSSMQGAGLNAKEASALLSTALRFCPACVHEGYHPIAHQHLAVSRCIRHNAPLQRECPQCRRYVVPTVRSIWRMPYQCDHCGQQLCTLESQLHRRQDPRAYDLALQSWHGALVRPSASAEGAGQRLEPSYGTTAILARQVQRATLFGAACHESTWRFPTEVFLMPAAQMSSSGPRSADPRLEAADAIAPLLQWLSRNCPGADDACRLATRLGRRASGLCLNDEASLAGVMLAKTLYCYDLMDDFCLVHLGGSDRPLKCSRYAPVRFTAPISESRDLDRRLLRLEILGLLAALIVKHRQPGFLWKVQLLEFPPAITFAPSWLLRPLPSGEGELHLRARADEAAVLRLFRRYQGARFAFDASLEAPPKPRMPLWQPPITLFK